MAEARLEVRFERLRAPGPIGVPELRQIADPAREVLEVEENEAERGVVVEDSDQDQLFGRRRERRKEELPFPAHLVQVVPPLRGRQLGQGPRRRVSRSGERGDVRDLVPAGEPLLREQLTARVDHQCDPDPRVPDERADRLAQRIDHLGEVPASHDSASATWRASTCTRP